MAMLAGPLGEMIWIAHLGCWMEGHEYHSRVGCSVGSAVEIGE